MPVMAGAYRPSHERYPFAPGLSAHREVQASLARCPRHAATPLVLLPALAERLGVASVAVKNEAERFGLQSFKALGGGYAVACALERMGRPLQPAPSAPVAVTFVCASDGNHGRAVAFAARHFGARAVVYLHAGVSGPRRDAISALGAELEIVDGSYDDAVDAAAAAAERQGWTLISDTSQALDDASTSDVMSGYTVVIAEACDQAEPVGGGCPFTHVFVQAGVGGLAAAVAGYTADRFGPGKPRIVVVEPQSAACLAAAAQAGGIIRIPGDLETTMAMLACGEASRPAWVILQNEGAVFLQVDDAEADAAVRRFARPLDGDPALAVGESGAAGLAGLLQASASPAERERLRLGADACVLILATEGPTDPERYARILAVAEVDG